VSRGRHLSLVFDDFCDLSILPESRKALFEALCQSDKVIHVSIGVMRNPEAMLKDFSDCCDAIRGVQLITFECLSDLDSSVVQNFTAALRKRVELGKSPMMVGLQLQRYTENTAIQQLTTVNRKREYEQIGFFLGFANYPFTDGFKESLSKELYKRSFGVIDKNEIRINHDSDADSDSLIDSSDEEAVPDALRDQANRANTNSRAHHRDHQRQQSSAADQSEPRVRTRKRDKCVVS
jgi:hypothetical protein